MPLFLIEHLEGCTPLEPCASCKAADFLKRKLNTEDFNVLLGMARHTNNYRALADETFIDDIPGLPRRVKGCLHSAEMATVGDVVKHSESDLYRIPNMGRTSVRQLVKVLAEGGRTLAPNPAR